MCRLFYPAVISIVLAGCLAASNPSQGAAGPEALYLAVTVNGAPTGKIAAFTRYPDGRVMAERHELRQIGIRAEGAGPVDLATLVNISFRIDDRTQEILFQAGKGARLPKHFDARAASRQEPQDVPQPGGFGSVLNYTFYGSSNADFDNWFSDEDHSPVVSGTFEGRIFGSLGVLSHSMLGNSGLEGEGDFIRLDTTWSYSDPETLRVARAGDIISGGLSWTRPVRLGGVQYQRNFSLQPDLVTIPAPAYSGSAALPSSVEIYADNVRVFDKDVPAGPFVISNIPVVTGGANAQVVVRDSLGRESVSNLPFYASPIQLREGLFDFSIEAGVPRRSFGVASNDYDGEAAALASLRYGLTNNFTVEGHGEITEGLVNAGVGAVFSVGAYGVASIAAAASREAAGREGGLVAASFETRIGGATMHLRTRRAFDGYADLATHTARPARFDTASEPYRAGLPLSLDQAVLAFPVPFDAARIAINYTRIEDFEGDDFRSLGLSVSRPLSRNASLYANGFTQLGNEANYGLFAGLTYRLGQRMSATASVSSGPDGSIGGLDISRPEEAYPGSYGWRLRDREGDRADRLASASYRTRSARLQGTVQQYGDAVRVSVEADGGIVLAGGDLFMTPRIHDAFAVVDAGAPGVEVFRENRLVGQTDSTGKLIIAGLNAYEPNRISIDPRGLPVDARVRRTSATVTPADRSGVVADFGVETGHAAARIVLRGANGKVIAAGSRGRIVETGEDFIVGYDGLAYPRVHSARNSVKVVLVSGSECQGRFTAPAPPDAGLKPLEVVCL